MIGVSVKAATLMFDLEYDTTALAKGDFADTPENYWHLSNSRNALMEYISFLEENHNIKPQTFYRKD